MWNRKITPFALLVMLAATSCNAKEAAYPAYPSGWLFVLTHQVGEETHIVKQCYRATPKEMEDYGNVGPILRKFLAKMEDGSVLLVGAHTGDGSSGSTSHMLEVRRDGAKYILVLARGKSGQGGDGAVSVEQIEADMKDILVEGVSDMKRDQEMYAKMNAKYETERKEREAKEQADKAAAK